MKPLSIGIGMAALGAVLYLTSKDEKPLTPSDITAGDDVSIKGVSRLLLMVGGAVILYQVAIKKNK